METPDFQGFPKMGRLSREMIVTEKIDGTNAQLLITEDGDVFAGSRTRWLTISDDNFGFAAWAEGNKEDILRLGPGRHFGEWWGQGIQRRYGMKEKRFSLFNVSRWAAHGWLPEEGQVVLPESIYVVPLLYRGLFDTAKIDEAIENLAWSGSIAAPGFMDPEGIVVFHMAGNVGFKKTIKGDDVPKTMQK